MLQVCPGPALRAHGLLSSPLFSQSSLGRRLDLAVMGDWFPRACPSVLSSLWALCSEKCLFRVGRNGDQSPRGCLAWSD